MTTSATSPLTSASKQSSAPTKLPAQAGFSFDQLVKSKDNEKLVRFVTEGYSKAKQARESKVTQWNLNMAFFFGKHWAEVVKGQMPDGYRDKLVTPNAPYYKKRRTVNRTRAFVRTEHSKFLSAIPNVVAVPGSAEDQDVRAAYAAEQAWRSLSSSGKLRSHFTRASWWMVLTGNGFMKTTWDQQAIDKTSGEPGIIKFANITPYHLFVPDLREQDIEDQPYIINAYIKPVSWCEQYFGEKLGNRSLQGTVSSQNQILDDAFLNLQGAANKGLDSVVVYEAWIKPGATKLLPEGGVVIVCDDILVDSIEGLPYNHGQYPFTKFEHIPTATFYADSPVGDLIGLNREYNESRTDIADAARKMGRPQLLAQRGSIISQKMTNEAGLIIEYKQGTPPPQPLQLSPLPQYVVDQQDRILMDMEDVTGQHEVSRGQAPAGITAGTAINYLGEKDNQFLTPEYQSIEDGYGRIAEQGLELFVQYVDIPRKIKTIGADMAFDTMALQGSDILGGTDVRVEPGSSIGQSKAASDARVMDMFAMGLIDQSMALRLIEIGGSQKVVDLLYVAERKAQRENIKMKSLKPEQIQQHQMEFEQSTMGDPMAPMGAPMEGDPMADPMMGMEQAPPPPVVAVDDFDVHEIHIETHNKFRMSQEYEMLSPEVKEEFSLHVAEHESMAQEKQMMQMMQSVAAGGDPMGDPSGDPAAPGGMDPSSTSPEASMAGNGQVPAPTPTGG